MADRNEIRVDRVVTTPHHVDSTPRPSQTDWLWGDLCEARQRIADLESAVAGLLAMIDDGATLDEIQSAITRARAALKETPHA